MQRTVNPILHKTLIQGNLAIRTPPPPRTQHTALGKCYCRVLGGAVSYERGNPVPEGEVGLESRGDAPSRVVSHRCHQQRRVAFCCFRRLTMNACCINQVDIYTSIYLYQRMYMNLATEDICLSTHLYQVSDRGLGDRSHRQLFRVWSVGFVLGLRAYGRGHQQRRVALSCFHRRGEVYGPLSHTAAERIWHI